MNNESKSVKLTFQLIECLKNTEENDMVRHECAEALGSIATEDISQELAKYLDERQPG